MYATGIAELVALVIFWWPGLELVGAAALALVLLGALATLQAPRGSSPYCPARTDAAPGWWCSCSRTCDAADGS